MRPEFHFTARGWINDPHGITYADGVYHLFFQYVPDSTAWSLACSWGHARGSDLFSMTELPPALTPGDGDDGIWSGSLVVAPDGSPRIFYTSVSAEHPAVGRVRTATTTDPDWMRWEKGPVVALAPPESGVQVFRDPVVFADDTGWHMTVGAGLADNVAAAVGFSSTDGINWRPTGLVASRRGDERHPVWSGSMWECPQIIEIDGQHVFIVSVWDQDELHDVLYALGRYENACFSAHTWGHLSFGPSPYAATTFRDASDRPCLVFWLRGIEGDEWSGAHSLPYRMTISEDRLSLTPHPDLDLYMDHDGEVGNAVDILWPEGTGPVLQIVQDSAHILEIGRDAHLLSVRVGGLDHEVPCVGDVRVIVDASILEISSSAGVFASPITPLTGDWKLVGRGITRRRLTKQARK